MSISVNSPAADEKKWIYARLTVFDGERQLKPTQVAYDQVCFANPPHLVSAQVEILLVNGNEEQRHTAVVLPHDAEATRIPIRLL